MGNPSQPLNLQAPDTAKAVAATFLPLTDGGYITTGEGDKAEDDDLDESPVSSGRRARDRPPGEPPDGGYGWVIVASTFLASICIGIGFTGFSILYVEWTEYFQAEKGVTGWIGSLHMASGNFLSVFVSVLVKKYGCRVINISGSIIACAGYICSAFSPNIYFLYLSYGLVAGLGLGMVILPSTVIVQQYFTTKRAFAAGLSTCGLSLGTVVAGPSIQYLIDQYGWRGALVLMGGCFLQCSVFGVLYRPPPKYKRRRRSRKYLKRTSQILQSFIDDQDDEPQTQGKDYESACDILCDITPLKNNTFLVFAFGTMLLNFGVMPFYQHTPGRALYYGVERHKMTLLPLTIGLCTAGGRVLFSYFASLNIISRTTQYALGVLVAGILVLTYVFAVTFPAFVFWNAFEGFCFSSFFAIQPTIVVDLLGVENAARGMAFLTMFLATGYLLSVPFAGFLYDISGSYDLAFYVAGSIQIFAAFILFYIPIKERKKNKRDQDASKKNKVLEVREIEITQEKV